jgi:hypothetical protein
MEFDKITYKASKKSVEQFPTIIEQQRKTLIDLGLTAEQIEKALVPSLSFMAQIQENILRYEEEYWRKV